jgi:hypothetical protein
MEYLFCYESVAKMEDKKVQSIAAEPVETQKERARLNEELEKLRRGRQTLETYKVDEAILLKDPLSGKYTPVRAWNEGNRSPDLFQYIPGIRITKTQDPIPEVKLPHRSK